VIVLFPGIIPLNNLGEPVGVKYAEIRPIDKRSMIEKTSKTSRINANFETREFADAKSFMLFGTLPDVLSVNMYI
jgi:hypothetical protein